MPSLGSRALVDVSDGDTPNVRMPIRMLSVDTPEVTAGTPARVAAIDQEFAQLREWIRQGRAPISPGLADYLLPRLASGGTLQFQQGTAASDFAKRNIQARLSRPDGTTRNLFIRVSNSPFDNNNRLLAYIAPSYSATELNQLTRAERATFNLDLITHGWAAPFVIYPSIPGELDLPLLVEAARTAREAKHGIWADPLTLLAYEYRAVEKLHRITERLVAGQTLSPADRYAWRERYCADMRTRLLYGPEDYITVPPEYRLWLWPADLGEAIGRLNLIPAPELGAPR
jgi:endonuclease YncB( thermonuclease family)